MTLGSRLFHLKFVVAFSSFVSKTKKQSEFRPVLMGGKSYKKRGRIKKEVRRFKRFDFGVFREPMDKVW